MYQWFLAFYWTKTVHLFFLFFYGVLVGRQLSIQFSRIGLPLGNHFPKNSISIGSWPTNGPSRKMALKFVLPTWGCPSATIFLQIRFLLVPGAPMGFRGK